MGNAKRRSHLQGKLNKLTSKISWVKKKGGCCSVCGYNKNLAALDFHHTDPKTKTKKPNAILRDKNQTELDSCILVCRICHGKLHAKGKGVKYVLHNYAHLLNMLGRKCRNCGVGLNSVNRDFDLHHPPGVEKTGIPSVLIKNYKKNKDELKQLVPLCKNCHQEIHNEHLFVGEPLDIHLRELKREFGGFPEVRRVEKEEFLKAVDKCKTMLEVSEYLEIGLTAVKSKIEKFSVTKYLRINFKGREEAFREMLERGEHRTKVMGELGIGERTFYRWKKRI